MYNFPHKNSKALQHNVVPTPTLSFVQPQSSCIRASLFPVSCGFFQNFLAACRCLASVQRQALSCCLSPLAEEISQHKLFSIPSCVSSLASALSIQNVQYLYCQTGVVLSYVSL